jgi:hypothetical protein
MEPYNLGHSLGYDEIVPKHNKVISITGEEVNPQLAEDRLECARPIVYSLLGELLLAILGVLMWKLLR